jgi:two-component system, LuxR family, response regulator FixJ
MTETQGTVFVVDDDPPVRRALSRVLTYAGFNVMSFASATEFLAHTGREHPACLVLDVRMPGRDGFELLATLQAHGRDLPVIIITGHGDIPMAARASKAGAVNFLTKPFDEDVLLDAVNQALLKSRPRDGR